MFTRIMPLKVMVEDVPTALTVVPGPVAGTLEFKPRLRGVSHEVAAFVFPVMGLVAVLAARSGGNKVALGVYTAGVTGMYAASACYHRGNWTPTTRSRLRRLDHSMILVGIASTYTAVAVLGLSKTTAWALLAAVWAVAIAGAVMHSLWLAPPQWLTGILYIGIGWAALPVLPIMWTELGVVTTTLLIVGGIIYSVGAFLFNGRRADLKPEVFGYHEVFHALVLLGGVIFYAAIIDLALRA